MLLILVLPLGSLGLRVTHNNSGLTVMATIGDLKTQIAFYLQQSTSDFVVGSVDMLLVELNNARRTAESARNWHCEERSLSLTVSPTLGGEWSAAVGLYGYECIKTVKQYYISTCEGDIPIRHVTKSHVAYDKRKELKSVSFDYNSRWKGDDGSGFDPESNPIVYVYNKTVFLDPVPSDCTDLSLDAYIWLNDYTGNTDEDWFTEAGADYLKWACIVALNYRTGTFAPRQEGTMSPPEKAKNDAYEAMRLLDSHQYETGRVPFAS